MGLPAHEASYAMNDQVIFPCTVFLVPSNSGPYVWSCFLSTLQVPA